MYDEIDRLLQAEAFNTLADLAKELARNLEALLTCSLPRDVSGERIVAEARAVLKRAKGS